MRILFLAPYPAYESPSQRYRFEHYLEFFHQKGIQYRYEPFLSMAAWKIFFKPGHHFRKITGIAGGFARRWILMFTVAKYDYVFIHREAAPLGPPVFEWIIARLYRKKIIYDFDDAIWIPVASQYNKMARYVKWFSKVRQVCKWSYKVAAGNSFLATFASRYNSRGTEILPTVVDTESAHNRLQNHVTDNPAIGWTGSFSTLKFLDIILPVLQRLQGKYDFTFIVIADKDPELPLKNYRFIKWKKETEIADLLNIHIGLMPLYDDDLAKGKCGFKAIQYMSLGIPAVVSPVGVNTEIVNNGINGYICQTEQEWEDALTLLLNHPELRQKMGAAARDKIVKFYSVLATRDQFKSLFS
ncbi:MAG: glycosyltransferase family 4 protein [Chitinophagaceae bacterium]|nr:glycosyltransferase family 4 protein [Chitinophagaceae bacterium]